MPDPASITLSPCPFCGGRARLVEPMHDLLPYVECIRCGVKNRMSLNNDQAIAAWEKRTALAAPSAPAVPAERVPDAIDGALLRFAYEFVRSRTLLSYQRSDGSSMTRAQCAAALEALVPSKESSDG